MIAFIARRTLLAALSIWVISIMAFTIIQLPPGDAVDRYLAALEGTGPASKASNMIGSGEIGRKEAAALRVYLGMDKPMYYRYGKWAWNIVRHGDFGVGFMRIQTSVAPGMIKVTEIVQDRLWLTIALTAGTVVFVFVVSFPIGIYSAVRQYSAGDYTVTFVGFIGLSVPDFLLALVMMYIFFAYFDWSVGGLFSGDYEYAGWSFWKFVDLLKHMLIPVVVIGTAGTAGTIRVLRNNLLDEMRKPYVVTARSKGMASWKVVLKYPVRVAINPVISNIGSVLPALVSGSVIVSVILDLPTVGPLLLNAIRLEDQMIGGFIILMLGILTVVGVLISDIMLVIVDPRIKMWK
jgi:peptide/nickel transport system permease protein